MSIEEVHREVLKSIKLTPQPYDPRLEGIQGVSDLSTWLQADSRTYYLYLNALVRVLKPKTVVELGTCQGGSTLFMLLALPEDSRLITVDLIDRADFLSFCHSDPRLVRIFGNDLDLAIYKDNDMKQIDLLFIDTEHSYEQVSKEWSLYKPLLSPSAVIAFDDIHLNPGMQRFWDELEIPKVDTGAEFHQSGFGIATLSM